LSWEIFFNALRRSKYSNNWLQVDFKNVNFLRGRYVATALWAWRATGQATRPDAPRHTTWCTGFPSIVFSSECLAFLAWHLPIVS